MVGKFNGLSFECCSPIISGFKCWNSCSGDRVIASVSRGSVGASSVVDTSGMHNKPSLAGGDFIGVDFLGFAPDCLDVSGGAERIRSSVQSQLSAPVSPCSPCIRGCGHKNFIKLHFANSQTSGASVSFSPDLACYIMMWALTSLGNVYARSYEYARDQDGFKSSPALSYIGLSCCVSSLETAVTVSIWRKTRWQRR